MNAFPPLLPALVGPSVVPSLQYAPITSLHPPDRPNHCFMYLPDGQYHGPYSVPPVEPYKGDAGGGGGGELATNSRRPAGDAGTWLTRNVESASEMVPLEL